MAYKQLNSSLQSAMEQTISKWDRQDQVNKIPMPSEINNLLQAFLSLINAYLARLNNTSSIPFGEKSDMIGTTG